MLCRIYYGAVYYMCRICYGAVYYMCHLLFHKSLRFIVSCLGVDGMVLFCAPWQHPGTANVLMVVCPVWCCEDAWHWTEVRMGGVSPGGGGRALGPPLHSAVVRAVKKTRLGLETSSHDLSCKALQSLL